MNIKIYALIEPITLEIKYIGKTKQPLNKRLSAHLAESHKSNTKKNTWLKSLKKKNLKPLIEELDACTELDWEFWEQYWISQFKAWGFELKNTDEGGKGQSSEFMRKNNPMFKKKNRMKVSKSLMGNQFAKGHKHSEETKEKVSENHAKFWLGKNRSENTKLKVSKSKSHPILQFNLDGKLINKFYGVSEAEEKVNVERSSLYRCLNGKTKTYKNHIWKWA